jgi:glyoxalase family protein
MTIPAAAPLLGMHHITALASDAQRNVDFYSGLLGLRLVKKTVNFDAPDVYHLYFGDSIGSPGTVLTFFPFPRAAQGIRGRGELGALAFHLPAGSEDYWIQRLAQHGVAFAGPEARLGNDVIALRDPDGLRLELVFTQDSNEGMVWDNGPVPPEHSVRRLFGATMIAGELEPSVTHLEQTLGFTFDEAGSGRRRYSIGQGSSRASLDIIHDPSLPAARPAAGSIHHIAWRVPTDTAQHSWRERLGAEGMSVTEVVDRQYFRSIYYREPGGVLFELATDQPGFMIDEAFERLGTSLKLPPWLEDSRNQIERMLPSVQIPGYAETVTRRNV